MHELYAQDDLLIDCVGETPVSGTIVEPVCGVTILAEGEATGHRHAIYDTVLMFRDDSLARDVPQGLYVGHVRVESPSQEWSTTSMTPLACRGAPIA